ncbi:MULTISPECIES: valine--pyruvate transaminase [Spirulina sp. CCY15215]|uniref:valine--pyruvate transaminase n=1 Tax=Spirulina sp. CCY15215 TaxID=2767591 RepID=UPI0019526958|nr:valine--pyruvate transaminase [Spirulina major]
MTLNLSQFGLRMSQRTGVREIMKDIIETLRASKGREFINLSAGNPVILPEIEQLWRDCTAELLASGDYGEVVCRYGTSQGYAPLIEAIAADFNQRYNLNLSDRNILISPGSQALYFYAANAFGGYNTDGQLKQIVLPLCPDYTGYGGVSLFPEAVVAYKPNLEIEEKAHRFKYRPNLNQLKINKQTGCVIFSRPCNPTGNVLSDREVETIVELAKPDRVPVFIDSAYAPPYPALNFTEMSPILGENIVHCMSLSKAGLPGERIGIAIADPETIDIIEGFQNNTCIHSPRYGQAIAAKAIASGRLAELSETVIRPHYQHKFAVLEATLEEYLPQDLPWFLHRGEGAIFAWLWLRDLPITDWELYQKVKEEGVILVPGSTFFPGLQEEWEHQHQCLRISLTATPEEIVQGMRKLAEVTIKVYAKAL